MQKRGLLGNGKAYMEENSDMIRNQGKFQTQCKVK